MRKRTRLSSSLRPRNWKSLVLKGLGILVIVLVLVQIFYPGDRLKPIASIDGKSVGWQKKSDATKLLNDAYDNYRFSVHINETRKPLLSPTLREARLVVDNTDRVQAMKYSWYIRIIPTSLFWPQGPQAAPSKPKKLAGHDSYVDQKLMPMCRKDPVDASLKADGENLAVVPAVSGGQCTKESVQKTLASLSPHLPKSTELHMDVTVIAPKITDKAAAAKKQQVEKSVGSGVKLMVGDETVSITPKDFYSWLDFANQDDVLVASINADRSKDFIEKTISPKVSVKPGVSQITTRDFTEISRVDGSPGRALDVPQTLQSLADVANGKVETGVVAVKSMPATEQYTRTYSDSDAGLSALLANYAKDHKGTFGISLIELDGKKRRADYQGDKQFVTASTYKLFVGYSILKRIDEGKMSWDAEGACFNKMITNSDNPCAENFLGRVGLSTQTKEINALGLKNSNFTKEGGPFTTANDLTLLLGMIATGQNFSGSGQARMLSAMKANVYRQGIPAGANGQVADKVGFMGGLLHDAAIVYSPSGTYVLAVMTDGSSWATIADLARQIDSLRAR